MKSVPQTNIISFEFSFALQNTAPMLIFLNKLASFDFKENVQL